MIDTRKEDFIDDYIGEALEDPNDSREEGQLYIDALVEWGSSEIDKAWERHMQREMP